MAGQPFNRLKLAEAEQRIVELERELEGYRAANAQPAKKRRGPRRYDRQVIDELYDFSEQGEFIDEIFARWGIDEQTFEKWCEEHVELRAAVGPARALARGRMLQTLRKAMESRTAFPTALADRMLARIDREAGAQHDDAARLIVVAVGAGDAQSAGKPAQGVDMTAPHPTPTLSGDEKSG